MISASNLSQAPHRRKKRNWLLLVIEILLAAIALILLYPFYSLVATTLEHRQQIYNVFPVPSWFWGNYRAVFTEINFPLSFFNSLIICVGTEIIVVILGSTAGSVIGRSTRGPLQWLYFFFLTGLIIPLQTTMVPLFRLSIDLHLANTRIFLILNYAAGTIPFALLLYTGFMKSIPRELDEAAIIDGCSPFRLFWSILFPLLMPATGTIIVTTVYWYWNDFLGPLLFLQSPTKLTLITQIFSFETEHAASYGPIFALCTLATVPLIVFFLFTQKYLIRGLVQGALKG